MFSARIVSSGLSVLTGLLILLALDGCGVPVCALNFGKCDGVNKAPTTTSSSTSTSSLTLTTSASTVVVNGTATVTASGGTQPYTYTIFTGQASVNSTTGLFTASANAGPVDVRVTDATGTYKDILIQVTAN